jgi:hypothetical protein
MTHQAPKLSIAVQPDKPHLSAGQKKFNGLLKKIETQRQLVETWQTTTSQYQQRWNADFKPLLDEFDQLDSEMLHFLDDASDQTKFSKNDRQTLQELICALVTSLMGGEHDEALKLIYKKHTGSHFDSDQLEEAEHFKASFEETFGFKMDDDVDLDSLEDVTQYIFEKQTEEAEQRKSNAKPRKKSAQQLREEEEHANASRSVREIYRKLVSALHPDREIDPVERERKTVMMQRVNQAYTDNNLLGLLQLQLEIEQIDQSHINTIAEDQLKHYNRVLINQLDELQHEVSELTLAFKRQFNLPPFENITPANVARKYPKKLRELRADIQILKEQREELEDPKILKRWLKEQRHVLDMEAYLSAGMPDELFR